MFSASITAAVINTAAITGINLLLLLIAIAYAESSSKTHIGLAPSPMSVIANAIAEAMTTAPMSLGASI
jgi:hypothetical protein